MKMQTSIRVEKEFYVDAKKIFKQFGLTFGDAVNLFLAKVSMEKGIPFDLKIPNKETQQAIKEARENKNLEIVSFEELQQEIKQCVK